MHRASFDPGGKIAAWLELLQQMGLTWPIKSMQYIFSAQIRPKYSPLLKVNVFMGLSSPQLENIRPKSNERFRCKNASTGLFIHIETWTRDSKFEETQNLRKRILINQTTSQWLIYNIQVIRFERKKGKKLEMRVWCVLFITQMNYANDHSPRLCISAVDDLIVVYVKYLVN